MPKTGRSLIGTVAGFKSEWWPVFDRIAGRLHVGIRTITNPAAPVRPPSKDGSRRFARRRCASTIGGFTSCSDGKDGRST